jgi:hypothetical protein
MSRPTPALLIQLRFDRGTLAPHTRPMDEIDETTRNGLVAVVFCAIIGLIAYAGYFLH